MSFALFGNKKFNNGNCNLRLAATATAILKTPKRFSLTECNSETDQKNSFETKKNNFFYLHVYYAPPGPSGFKKISSELMFSN